MRIMSEKNMYPEKPPKDEGSNKIETLGYVYAMLPLSKEWRWFYLKKRLPMLYFYQSVKDNDFAVVYSIYKANVLLTHQFIPIDGKTH